MFDENINDSNFENATNVNLKDEKIDLLKKINEIERILQENKTLLYRYYRKQLFSTELKNITDPKSKFNLYITMIKGFFESNQEIISLNSNIANKEYITDLYQVQEIFHYIITKFKAFSIL